MDTKQLEAKIKELEARVTNLQDIEEIKKLQRIYGYYLDKGKWQAVVDLFSDNAKSVEISDSGVYLGKKGVDKCYLVLHRKATETAEGVPVPGILRTTMQVQGVVYVNPDGKTATGRWQTWMCLGLPVKGETKQLWGNNLYENEYIKEGGKWRFLKLHAFLIFRTPFEDGWAKTPVAFTMKHPDVKPDAPTTVYEPFPSDFTFPFSYNHPITGEVIT
jgi:hypothetical protein